MRGVHDHPAICPHVHAALGQKLDHIGIEFVFYLMDMGLKLSDRPALLDHERPLRDDGSTVVTLVSKVNDQSVLILLAADTIL